MTPRERYYIDGDEVPTRDIMEALAMDGEAHLMMITRGVTYDGERQS